MLILAIYVAAVFFVACASQGAKDGGAKDGSAKDERGDLRGEKIGVEDFMPEGARILYVRSCASCHGPDGHGVIAVAPDLYRAKYRPREEWEKYLRDSTGAHPAAHPPPLWLNAEEIKRMAEYIESATRQNQ